MDPQTLHAAPSSDNLNNVFALYMVQPEMYSFKNPGFRERKSGLQMKKGLNFFCHSRPRKASYTTPD